MRMECIFGVARLWTMATVFELRTRREVLKCLGKREGGVRTLV